MDDKPIIGSAEPGPAADAPLEMDEGIMAKWNLMRRSAAGSYPTGVERITRADPPIRSRAVLARRKANKLARKQRKRR